MNKKLLLVIPAAVTLLAGCGNKDDGKIHVLMWHNSNTTTENLLENFGEKFSEANPEYVIDFYKETGNYTAILTKTIEGLATGKTDTYPDIFLGYPDSVAQLMSTGRVVNLETFINDPELGWDEDDLDDLIPQYVDEGKHYQIPGTYTVPYAKSTEAMYYNKILEGLDLSNEDSTINGGQPLTSDYLNNLTWEELFEKLAPAILAYNNKLPSNKKIIDTSGKYAVLGWGSDDNAFITLCEQYGLPYTSLDTDTGLGNPEFNNPQVKSMLQKFHTAAQNHYFMTGKSSGGSYTNSLFTNRKSLFDIGSTGGAQYYSGNNNNNVDVRLAKIPHAADHDAKVINQGPSLAILSKVPGFGNYDERAVGAWKFYKFITNKTNADVFARTTGYSPIRNSVLNTREWAEYADPSSFNERSLEKTMAQIAQYTPNVSEDLFSSPVFNGSAACRTEVEGLFGEVMSLATWNDSTVSQKMKEHSDQAALKCTL